MNSKAVAFAPSASGWNVDGLDIPDFLLVENRGTICTRSS
jgi:hypothetical protein